VNPELATGVLILGGTAAFTAYAYHGPAIAPGPLVASAEEARARDGVRRQGRRGRTDGGRQLWC
jgi:hypothetical protein